MMSFDARRTSIAYRPYALVQPEAQLLLPRPFPGRPPEMVPALCNDICLQRVSRSPQNLALVIRLLDQLKSVLLDTRLSSCWDEHIQA